MDGWMFEWMDGWMHMSGNDAGAWKQLGIHMEADISSALLSASVWTSAFDSSVVMGTLTHLETRPSPATVQVNIGGLRRPIRVGKIRVMWL